jgi:CRISPR/Cas system-associated exonuclease Cas4 (RecB family)
MSLSPDFQFSQRSLQDYLDCPRRFELRYILCQKWPAIQTEPVIEQEIAMEEGRLFHQMVQRYIVGLPSDAILEDAASPDLNHWWLNLIQNNPLDKLPVKRYAELSLSAPMAGFRVIAQYDLVAVAPGERAVIIDWKTSAKKPSHHQLSLRLQTRIYRYLLVTAGAFLNDNQPLPPEKVEMVYWFAEFPADPESFPYDYAQYEADRDFLANMIGEIARLKAGQFFLTPDVGKCRFCVYRSLCDRGQKAGEWEDQEEEGESSTIGNADLGFEQIGEIEF